MYDLVNQVRGEVRNFLDDTVTITSIPGENNRTYDYKFSQRSNIALIDLYWNSKFSSGEKDAAGMQKLFMNVGRFRTDVAEMQIDIDASSFTFIPTGADYWTPWFMSKDFQQYVRDHDYGEVINDWGADLPRYGTAVSKKVGNEVKRLPIKRLMNTQDAESLKDAACSGGYVIEAMELTPKQMEEYPEWNLKNLAESDKTQVVYERYGLITEADIEMAKEGKPVENADSENFFLGMAVVSTDINKKHEKATDGLLFAEEVKEDDFPYEEVHWSRQDGRWQGIGVMEEQFQNQLAKNLTTHYRQKSMYWAGQRMFTTNTDGAPNNLATEVTDGGVVLLGTGGQITPINTQSQHNNDINAMDQMIDNQADQTSFTYEAATGDSPKAGTPYSLQVKVDQTLQKHFGKKKERFGAFLRRVFFEQQVPSFKKEKRKEHTLTFGRDEAGMFALQEAMVEMHTTDRWLKERAQLKRRPMAEIEAEVRTELEKSPYLVTTIPKGLYDDAKVSTDIIITGERKNLFAEMETLKTLLMDARQTGDVASAEKHLREILSLTGRMPSVKPVQPAQPAQQAISDAPEELEASIPA